MRLSQWLKEVTKKQSYKEKQKLYKRNIKAEAFKRLYLKKKWVVKATNVFLQ